MHPNFAFSLCAQAARPLRAVLCVVLALCVLSAATAFAKNVYENQPSITDKELLSFMELLPHFRAWAASVREEAHPIIKAGKADFLYSAKAAEWVQVRGWEPSRFFCVMGRAAAALSLVAEGNDATAQRPPDMPSVTPQEIALVRRHLAALLKAGSDAPPIKR